MFFASSDRILSDALVERKMTMSRVRTGANLNLKRINVTKNKLKILMRNQKLKKIRKKKGRILRGFLGFMFKLPIFHFAHD
jgi:hypothetical protein